MINKTKTIEFLSKYNFYVEKSEIFIDYDPELVFMINPKTTISIIIKEYDYFNEEMMIEDTVKARIFLKEKGINIWNTYYLFLPNGDLPIEDNNSKWYKIESNSRGLRKYLILTEEDFLRLPFTNINRIEVNPLVFGDELKDILQIDDNKVHMLISWMFDVNGDLNIINNNTLKKKINELLIGVETDEFK